MAKEISKEEQFYKAEYENLRRKKNKEIEKLKISYHNFIITTWQLLKMFMKEEDIIKYYAEMKKIREEK